jgi:GTP-binding protein HflX
VASFQSTLDEVREADILLHVVDLSHPRFEEQIEVVNDTLEEIGAQGKPVIMVFNKVDRVDPRSLVPYVRKNFDGAVVISALRGIHMASLEAEILRHLETEITEETVTLTQRDYPIVSQIHDLAEVLEKTYDDDSITLRFRINRRHADRLKKILARRRG